MDFRLVSTLTAPFDRSTATTTATKSALPRGSPRSRRSTAGLKSLRRAGCDFENAGDGGSKAEGPLDLVNARPWRTADCGDDPRCWRSWALVVSHTRLESMTAVVRFHRVFHLLPLTLLASSQYVYIRLGRSGTFIAAGP